MNMMSERLLKRLEVMGMISSFDLSAGLVHGFFTPGVEDNIDCSFCTVFRCGRGKTDPLRLTTIWKKSNEMERTRCLEQL
jgi:hypothetical protein